MLPVEGASAPWEMPRSVRKRLSTRAKFSGRGSGSGSGVGSAVWVIARDHTSVSTQGRRTIVVRFAYLPERTQHTLLRVGL